MRPIHVFLPKELNNLHIAPRHKTLLTHQAVNGKMYVVLLTDMPGDGDKVWVMSPSDYWNITSLHESRDRWVRNRLKPTYHLYDNPPKQQDPTLF